MKTVKETLSHSFTQGQLQLNHYSEKDFREEGLVPTAKFVFAHDAFLARMLFQQRQARAIEPGQEKGAKKRGRSSFSLGQEKGTQLFFLDAVRYT